MTDSQSVNAIGDSENSSIETILRPKRWFIYSVVGLMLFLIASLSVAAAILMRQGLRERHATIAGSSMEPNLRGPRLNWTCSNCTATQSFSKDSIVIGLPFRCERCGQLSEPFSEEQFPEKDPRWQSGEEVTYLARRTIELQRSARKQAQTYRGLKRGELVVLQESETAQREVKRLVGFPGESIELRQGDLWVDGKRWEKSMEELLTQSILLDYGSRRINIGSSETGSNDTAGANGIHIPKRYWTVDSETPITEIQLGPPNEFEIEMENRIAEEDEPGSDKEANQVTRSKTARSYSEIHFESGSPIGIENELAINAHDSHALVEVRDFGLGIQISDDSIEWEIKVNLNGSGQSWDIALQLSDGVLAIASEGRQLEINAFGSQSDHWLFVAMVDGYGVVATSECECLRIPLRHRKSSESQEAISPITPIHIQSVFGSMVWDQWVVFRDIYYRGVDDQPAQEMLANSGIVVLGDNVSISGDSRQRWVDGLAPNAIKGVIVGQPKGIQSLLRQRR